MGIVLGLALLGLIAFVACSVYALLQPNVTVYLDEEGPTVDFSTDHASPAEQILHVLYSTAYFRAHLPEAVPKDPSIVTTFDRVWGHLLEDWAAVEDGSVLRPGRLPHAVLITTPDEFVKIDVGFLRTSAGTDVAVVISPVSDPANLFYAFVALLVHSVALIPAPNRAVLRDALQRLRAMTLVHPSMPWSRYPPFQQSTACRNLFLAAAKAGPPLQARAAGGGRRWVILVCRAAQRRRDGPAPRRPAGLPPALVALGPAGVHPGDAGADRPRPGPHRRGADRLRRHGLRARPGHRLQGDRGRAGGRLVLAERADARPRSGRRRRRCVVRRDRVAGRGPVCRRHCRVLPVRLGRAVPPRDGLPGLVVPAGLG